MVSFGDPVPVLDSNVAYLSTLLSTNGNYYQPPVDPASLARLRHANAYHGMAMKFKVDQLCRFFTPSALLSRIDFEQAVWDYVVTGNCYFQKHYNRLGAVVRLSHLPAVYLRRAGIANVTDPLGVPDNFYVKVHPWGSFTQYAPDEVIHLHNYDLLQAIYGIPSYLCGVQDVLLSEEATLFRRKYFINGAHMGYILVTSDAGLTPEQADLIKRKVEESKGIGNGKSFYINIPRSGSTRDPVKIIPVGNIGTKDDFLDIKNETEQQIITAHGVPPILLGIIPENTGGLGNPVQALQIYHEIGSLPLRQVFLELNTVLGKAEVEFSEPDWKLLAA